MKFLSIPPLQQSPRIGSTESIYFQVLVFSLLCASCLKFDLDDDIDDAEEDEERPGLGDDEEWIMPSFIAKTRQYVPYENEYMTALKKARVKELRTKAIVSELMSYVVFLTILFIISYGNRDPNSFKLKHQIVQNLVIKNRFHKVRRLFVATVWCKI